MSEKFQPGTLISGWNRRHLKETQLVPLKRKEKLKPNKHFMYLSPADKLSTQSAEKEKRKQLFQGNCCCNEFKCCCNEFKLPINTHLNFSSPAPFTLLVFQQKAFSHFYSPQEGLHFIKILGHSLAETQFKRFCLPTVSWNFLPDNTGINYRRSPGTRSRSRSSQATQRQCPLLADCAAVCP